MYSTYLAQRREQLGPQDSGEWPPVRFRHLPKPAPEKTPLAPTLIASVIVLAGYVGIAASLDAEFAALAAILASPLLGVVGVLWIAQFRRLGESEGAWHGLAWGLAGFAAMTAVHPLLLVGALCAGLTGGGASFGAWVSARSLNRRKPHGNP